MAQARPSTLGSDADISDGMTEIELQKLQRQYRIMEGDRKAYSEESRLLITKQRANVDKLKRDHQQLQDQLTMLQQRNSDPRRRDATRRAEAMAEQAEMYQRKIRQIAAEIASLDESIAGMDKDVDVQRKKLGERVLGIFNTDAIDKQIRVLENRLDKALIKYNKALTSNKGLRSTIDSLRRERLVFDSLHRKFERDLLEEKRRVAEVVEASNAAYEARDEAQAKIVALRERAEKEGAAYAQEIKELDRALEQDKRLKEFMAAKIAERIKDSDHSGRRAGHDKDHLPAKLPSAEALAESIKNHESALADLQEATGCADAAALVEAFRASEDECFSLFAYVAEVHGEAERTAAQVDAARAAIQAAQAGTQVAEETRKQQMALLDEKLRGFKELSKHYEQAEQELAGAADVLRRAIEGLIAKLPTLDPPQPTIKPTPILNVSVDNSIGPINESEEDAAQSELPRPISAANGSNTEAALTQQSLFKRALSSELLEPGAGITDATVLAFLAALERRANQLLTLNFLLSPRRMPVVGADGEQIAPRDVLANTADKGVGLLGVGPAPALSSITIVAPSTGDDHDSGDDEDEGDERPLTREELLQKTLRVLSRREKSAAGTTKIGSGAKSRRRKTKKSE
ncbi:hypothetical protein SeMB42_g07516 [Synchytrium endobioticum]|nr:hypothetical protein SeMB42_g07516 [Synchytrium endobioticum]